MVMAAMQLQTFVLENLHLVGFDVVVDGVGDNGGAGVTLYTIFVNLYLIFGDVRECISMIVNSRV